MVGWDMFVDFMLYNGAITEKEVVTMKDEVYKFCQEVVEIQSHRCTEEQSGNALISKLKELLSTGEAGIENLDGYHHDRIRKYIGFVDNQDKAPNIAYLLPSATIELVKANLSDGLIITKHSAGVQLKADGVLHRTDTTGKKTQIFKKHNGMVKRVWCIDLSKLGITSKPRVVGGTQAMDIDQPMPNEGGLI
jgi:hypothetical protein